MDSPRRRHRIHRTAGGWVRQHKKILLISVVSLLIAVVALQVIYPARRALPFARLDGQSVAYVQKDALQSRLQTTFTSTQVTLAVDESHAVTKSLSELGAGANVEAMAATLCDYPLWQRLIPFSSLVLRPDLQAMDVYFSQQQLAASATAVAAKLSTSPADARLSLKDGKLVSIPAVDGKTVAADSLTSLLTTERYALHDQTIRVTSTTVPPKYGDADIEPVRQQAEAMISRQLTLTSPDGTVFSPSKATIASWLVLTRQPDHSMKITLDQKAIASYIDTINKQLQTPAGTTTITYTDGSETARVTGAMGRAVTKEPLVTFLSEAVPDETALPSAVIELHDVAPQVRAVRQYSHTQTGLRAYVSYVTSTEDVHIALAQLDGGGWTAAGRATQSIPSASTYKLYVAMMLFDKIDKGDIKWSDAMLDTDVSTCVEQMIVLSLNACAEQFIAEFGRSALNSFLYQRGISSATTFTAQGAVRTSAADLLIALKGLQNGTLYSGTNRSTLLEKMSRQIYRNGVPAGSNGSVQDKVGFLWDYNHDAAIVHTSRGTYAVAIMTRGASFQRIAQITTQLERIMYP